MALLPSTDTQGSQVAERRAGHRRLTPLIRRINRGAGPGLARAPAFGVPFFGGNLGGVRRETEPEIGFLILVGTGDPGHEANIPGRAPSGRRRPLTPWTWSAGFSETVRRSTVAVLDSEPDDPSLVERSLSQSESSPCLGPTRIHSRFGDAVPSMVFSQIFHPFVQYFWGADTWAPFGDRRETAPSAPCPAAGGYPSVDCLSHR